MLSIAEEAIIIAFRRHTRPPLCVKGDIDHRLTKPKQHPWTNGQVERMNRTLEDATIKRCYYETHDELRTQLDHFVQAHNYARRLKTLKGLTPYQSICKPGPKSRPDSPYIQSIKCRD